MGMSFITNQIIRRNKKLKIYIYIGGDEYYGGDM